MQAQLIGIPTQAPTYAYPNQPVTTANPAVKGVGFAIPANRIKFIVPQLIQYGRVLHSGHATLQATLVSVNPALAALNNLAVDSGAYISDVQQGGPAAQAGLQVGDVIVRVNDMPITNALDLTDALMTSEAGSPLALNVVRGIQRIHVQATPQQQTFNVKTEPVPQCSSSSTPSQVIGRG
jgi:putative serine protease PepD